MTRIAWLTDLHLNFVETADVQHFFDELVTLKPDAILFTGDLGESRDVVQFLTQIDERIQSPFFFVLGNHDFYFSSISQVRDDITEFCRSHPLMHYLTISNHFELAPSTGIVGHDGWADARIGDYERSYVMMNDYRLIAELSGYGKLERWPVLRSMGDTAAAHIRHVLPAALDDFNHVFLLTHVPPMREACWHQGRISDDEWAPHFTCKAMGDTILEIMRVRSDRQLTVLCGHTHGAGMTQPLPNVTILTGGAEYGKPGIARVFEIDSKSPFAMR